MNDRNVVGPLLARAYLDCAHRYLWAELRGWPVRRACMMLPAIAGDLGQLRAAGVGLVSETRTGYDLVGPVNRAFLAAGSPLRARDDDTRAVGLARPTRRSYDLAYEKRVTFPLSGVDDAVGVAAMALDRSASRWRYHRPAIGLPHRGDLVFAAGDEQAEHAIGTAVCTDPAAAMLFRSVGSTWTRDWSPSWPVAAPATADLSATQAQFIAARSTTGVAVVCVPENPRRAAQFGRQLGRVGLEVVDFETEIAAFAARHGAGRDAERADVAAGSDA